MPDPNNGCFPRYWNVIRMKTHPMSKIAVLAVALALAACGKKDPQQTSVAAAEPAKVTRGADGFETNEAGDLLLPREAVLPLERYTVLNQSKNFHTENEAETAQVEAVYRNVFWAGHKREEDLLASDFLPEVRAESDSFKRGDIAKQNQARLDAAYAEAQKQKHYAMLIDSDYPVSVGPYNPEKKGFQLSFGVRETAYFGWDKPSGSGNRYNGAWAVHLAGTDVPEEARWYIPKDETEARQIESSLSKLRGDPSNSVYVPTYFLGHVVPTPTRPNKEVYRAILMTDGLVLLDPATKKPLMTVDLQAREPKARMHDSELKAAIRPAAATTQ